ncbi:M15 family metallopeptidase [Mycolicibacterium parafortuitum]|uniref:M15 family metallopeptidase n=1 Tax=Mycolicibacterium parafortuitum TaxID=39692 RepID=UPI0009F1ABFE
MRIAGPISSVPAAALLAVLLASCTAASEPPRATQPAAPSASESAPLPPETIRRLTPVPDTPVPNPTVPDTPVPTPPAVHPVTATELGDTWRPGCPAAPDELRRVELDYWGFDGQPHRGELVVHRDLTDQVIEVFAALHELRYPIERMRTVDHYPGGDDELSMRDNNTSAFNCRGIPGSSSWSWHAYGRAIDVNPKLNPFVPAGGAYEPANAGLWVDRARTDPGMLHDGDPAVTAFTDRGWAWGGHWRSPLDYQHFEMP